MLSQYSPRSRKKLQATFEDVSGKVSDNRHDPVPSSPSLFSTSIPLSSLIFSFFREILNFSLPPNPALPLHLAVFSLLSV